MTQWIVDRVWRRIADQEMASRTRRSSIGLCLNIDAEPNALKKEHSRRPDRRATFTQSHDKPADERLDLKP